MKLLNLALGLTLVMATTATAAESDEKSTRKDLRKARKAASRALKKNLKSRSMATETKSTKQRKPRRLGKGTGRTFTYPSEYEEYETPACDHAVNAKLLWNERGSFDKALSRVTINTDGSFLESDDDGCSNPEKPTHECCYGNTEFSQYGGFAAYPSGYRSLAHHDSILGNREEDKACTWDYMDDYNYDIGSNLGNDDAWDYLAGDEADYWGGICCNARLDSFDRGRVKSNSNGGTYHTSGRGSGEDSRTGFDQIRRSSNCAGMDWPHCRPPIRMDFSGSSQDTDSALWYDSDVVGRYHIALQCQQGQRLTVAAHVPGEQINLNYNASAGEYTDEEFVFEGHDKLVQIFNGSDLLSEYMEPRHTHLKYYTDRTNFSNVPGNNGSEYDYSVYHPGTTALGTRPFDNDGSEPIDFHWGRINDEAVAVQHAMAIHYASNDREDIHDEVGELTAEIDELHDEVHDIEINASAVVDGINGELEEIGSRDTIIEGSLGALGEDMGSLNATLGLQAAVVAGIEGNVEDNAAAVDTNTNDIASNVAAVDTNTNDIASNVAVVHNNTHDIASIAAAVDTNANDIASIAAAVDTNANDIVSNAAVVHNNTNDIASNVAAVDTNTNDIASNVAAVDTNTNGIASNAAAVETNAASVSILEEEIIALKASLEKILSAVALVDTINAACFDEGATDDAAPVNGTEGGRRRRLASNPCGPMTVTEVPVESLAQNTDPPSGALVISFADKSAECNALAAATAMAAMAASSKFV